MEFNLSSFFFLSFYFHFDFNTDNLNGDKALKTIIRRLCGNTRNGACPNVEQIMLSDGCKLTDKGMQMIARRCPELTHLQIQFSVNVTNSALFDVVTRCTNLQHLDITGEYSLIKRMYVE